MAFPYHFGEERLPLGVQELHGGWAYHDVDPIELEDSDDYEECEPDEDIPEETTRFAYNKEEYPWLGWLGWSRDGERIFGYTVDRIYNSSAARAYCVNASNGKPLYSIKVGRHVAYSPDEQYIAFTVPGGGGGVLKGSKRMAYTGLEWADAHTGKTLAEAHDIDGIVELHWSDERKDSKLAVITRPSEEKGMVHIFQGTQQLCSFETGLHPEDLYGELPDRCLWSWSPDGTKGLVLTRQGVECWAIEGTPKQLDIFSCAKEMSAIFWGAEDVIVSASSHGLEFYDMSTKTVLHTYRMLGSREELMVQTPSPLLFGEIELNDIFPIKPLLPIQEPEARDTFHWLGAFARGPVICPKHLQETLDAHLHYTSIYQDEDGPLGAMTWPYRWGEVAVYDNFEEGLADPSIDIEDELREELIKQAAQVDKEEVFSLDVSVPTSEQRPSFERFDRWYDETADELAGGHNDHYYLQCVYESMCGRIEQAIERAMLCSERYESLSALTQGAMMAAVAGHKDETRDLLDKAAQLLAEEELGDWYMTYVYAPMYGAYALLGDERAEDALQKALVKFDDESNGFQKKRLLMEAYIYNDCFEEALEIYEKHGERGGHFSLRMEMPVIKLMMERAPKDVYERFMGILAPNVVDNNNDLLEPFKARFIVDGDWDTLIPWLKRSVKGAWYRTQVVRDVLMAMYELGQKQKAQEVLGCVLAEEDLLEGREMELFDLQVLFDREATVAALQERVEDAPMYIKANRYCLYYVISLASAAALAGKIEIVKQLTMLYPDVEKRAELLATLCANEHINVEVRRACWAALHEELDEDRQSTRLLLLKAAHLLGEQEAFDVYMEQLAEGLLSLSGYDKTWAIESIVSALTKLGRFEEAYVFWSKLAASARKSASREFFRALGEEGMLDALALLVYKIPKDERLFSIARALEGFVHRRIPQSRYTHEL